MYQLYAGVYGVENHVIYVTLRNLQLSFLKTVQDSLVPTYWDWHTNPIEPWNKIWSTQSQFCSSVILLMKQKLMKQKLIYFQHYNQIIFKYKIQYSIHQYSLHINLVHIWHITESISYLLFSYINLIKTRII